MSTSSCQILALKYHYPRAEAEEKQDMPGSDVSGNARVRDYKNPLPYKNNENIGGGISKSIFFRALKIDQRFITFFKNG